MTTKNSDKVRDAMTKALRKAQGDGAVVDLRGNGAAVEALPSGIDVLDGHVIGCGGWPIGRIAEVYGHEGSGKSSLAFVALAAVQRIGGLGVLLETEHAFDPARARALGVDTDALVMSQPDTLEDLLTTAETIIDALPERHPAVIVWDSVAATPTRAEAENGVVPDGEGMAEYARVMSRALRVMCSKLARKRATLLCVNQTRSKPGIAFGNPETTPGGNALKFYASLRISISPGTAVKEGAAMVGKDLLVSAIKNKVAPPFRNARVRLRFDVGSTGFDNVWSTVNFAKDRGALPESAKVTEANRVKALDALLKATDWRAPVQPPAAAPAAAPKAPAAAPAPTDDDVPGGD